MKLIEKVQNRWKGLTIAITRFPLMQAFLLLAAVVNAIDIQSDRIDYTKYLLTLVVGAFLSAFVQVIYERFFHKAIERMILSGGAVLLTLLYYYIIRFVPKLSVEIGARTAVALFALLIAFILIPVIYSKISFNKSFMISFKAFFVALFFSWVLFAGLSIILVAINQLLYQVDSRAYAQTANIIFVIFAPMYFVSLIPVYSLEKISCKKVFIQSQLENDVLLEKNDSDNNLHEENDSDNNLQEENDSEKDFREEYNEGNNSFARMAHCPKYLEILISYIIIPLVMVFTIILLLYIVRNIGGRFWTNNLLEPMIVSYSIVVILVYILASELSNKSAAVFRRIFPKVLVPIVLFQTISSILRMKDYGIVYTRYYVILYGIFATLSGIVFSIMPVKKNGIVAAMLIGFSLFSIIPPYDAFTISRKSQIDILESVLLENNMLSSNTKQIIPKDSLSDLDKVKISQSLGYLNQMDYTTQIAWLPEGFDYYEDFYNTFGFNQYEQKQEYQPYINLSLSQNTPINIAEYDYFICSSLNINGGDMRNEKVGVIEKAGKKYTLSKNIIQNQAVIILEDENNREILSLPSKKVFEKYENYYTEKGLLSAEEAAVTMENDQATITVVIQNLNIDKTSTNAYYGADVYILVQMK